jgi:hypothetical protein
MNTSDGSDDSAHIVIKNVGKAVISGNTYSGGKFLNAESVDDLSSTDNKNVFPPSADAAPQSKWYAVAAWQLWLLVAAIIAAVIAAWFIKSLGLNH